MIDPESKFIHVTGDIQSLRDTVVNLNHRVERLVVFTRVLTSLLTEKIGMTELELLEGFQRFEAAKGEPKIRTCHACERPMSQKHTRCLYCGEARRVDSVLDLL